MGSSNNWIKCWEVLWKILWKVSQPGGGVWVGFAAAPLEMVSAVSSLLLQLVAAQSLAVPEPSLGAQVTQDLIQIPSELPLLFPCSGRGLENHNLGLH